MMRCMLHSSDLGPEYWSNALSHAVWIKNQLPTRSLNTTLYEAFIGRHPNMAHLQIFGSPVYARKPGQPRAKLDHHTDAGIFIGNTATGSNFKYIDDQLGLVKSVTSVIFDEAHMSQPACKVPLVAQALQCLGHHSRELWITHDLCKEQEADTTNALCVEQLSVTGTIPTRGSEQSVGYNLYMDDESESMTIEPRKIGIIKTGIAAKEAPSGTYLRIAPRSGLTVKCSFHTLAGVIDPDYTGEVMVVLQNFGSTSQTLTSGDKIAQFVVEKASTP